MKKINKKIISITVGLGEHRVDWIRTIYFSLFGSATLGYIIKMFSMSLPGGVYYVLGDIMLLLGMLVSMRMSDSVKASKLEYESLDPEDKRKFDGKMSYLLQKEGRYWYQYYILYGAIILSLLFIGISSFTEEQSMSMKNQRISDKVEKIDKYITGQKLKTDNSASKYDNQDKR
jgi:hypothetical protein